MTENGIAGKFPIKAERPTICRPFRCPQIYLQFLQFLASEAFLEAFACLPDCALELSLVAEDCLPFALDLVFSMFTPFGGSPPCSDFCLSRVVCRSVRGFIHRLRGYSPRTPPCGGIIPPHPHARGSSPRAPFRRQTFISAAPAMKRRLHSSCSACKHAHRTSS